MRAAAVYHLNYITGVIGRAMNATCLSIREAIHQSGSYIHDPVESQQKERKKEKKKLINN
jgi:hypothetical protein